MTSPPARPRPPAALAIGLALLLAIGLLAPAQPTEAAQGFGPTTELTGPVDGSSQQAPAAFAQGGCFPAGGSTIPDPSPLPDGDFVFIGGGWGHGAGMSQYGAQGAGRLGCSAEQILTSYFPGTALGSRPMPTEVVIGLASSLTATDVTASAGTIPWELCHFQTGECSPLPVQQRAGTVWRIDILSDATYRISQDGEVVFEGGDFELNLRAILSPDASVDRRVLVAHTGHTYRWGVLQFDSVARGPADAVVTVEIPSMDLYLRGLAEVPANWPAATLQAQAVAGRSYAMRKIAAAEGLSGGLMGKACRCHLVDTPADQNYEGWDYERADAQGGANWREAVEATSGQVLLHEGEIAQTFYSSSHGGHSESTAFVFGGALPYATPVDDSRWDLASSNPLRRWTFAASAEQVGAVAGVGTATQVELLDPRGAAGRVGHPSRGFGGVRVTGTDGQVTITGDDLRRGLGLRSTLYRLVGDGGAAPDPSPSPAPAPDEPEPDPDGLARAAGGDRIATAVAASVHGWDASPDVVLAAAGNFPDALAGIRLAASLAAPLLLNPTTGLHPAVQAELQRLGTDTVWLLGGEAALSSRVGADLADLGISTRRLSGIDRFATAAAIARVASPAPTAEVTIALGQDWPDAVSASSLAALVDGPPTLLVQRTTVPGSTVQAIRDLGATRAVVVGGTAVVAASVVDELAELGLSVTRLAGADRFATAGAVAVEALDRRAASVAPLVVAAGSGFADALSAGALAAREGGVLVLAPRTSLEEASAVRAFLQSEAARLDGGVVVGGTSVISTTVEGQIEQLLAQG